MKDYIVQKRDNYYISEYPRQWFVQMVINGNRISKNFSFRKFGSKEEALIQAKAFRDNLVKKHDIDLASRFKKSKTTGVQKTLDKKNDTYYWQAVWTENGKQKAKRFSTKKYGENQAKENAINHRKEKLDLIAETGQTLFEKPEPNTNIWRYMDFTKFVYMLEKGALFFPTIDSFNDPYEGSYSNVNKAKRNFIFSKSNNKNELANQIEKINKLRPDINVNCWHMNEFESAGMWKLYSKTNESICIKTQFKRLEKSLPTNIKFGKVKYINYKRDWIPEYEIYHPFIYKRTSFEHEKELRAILDSSSDKLDERFEKTQNGYWIKINLITLIQQIYVSPEAPDWFVELVEKVKNKYNLKLKRVYKSPLNENPNFE